MSNKNNKIFLMIFWAFGVVGILSLLHSSSVLAYSASITTDSSATVNVSASGNGVGIESKTINVTSDCRSGYNLVVATTEDSDLYINGDNTEDVAFTAVDGTSILDSDNNTNRWGYSLDNDPSGNTVFLPLSATGSILKTPVETASPDSDINDSFSIHYGAKVDSSVVSGLYQMENNGSIVYYLTMDITCTHYTVNFNANGGTGAIASQSIQQGEATKLVANTITAPTGASYTDADNNTITGDADKLWTFWGWNTAVDGTGDWYKDKEEALNIVQAGNTVTLYAQWKQATLADMVAGTQTGSEKVIDHNLMQDMAPEICYNSPITTAANAPAATLLDYRGKVTTGDNPEAVESYTVSKLADGNCWMTTNLNLGRTSGGPNGNGTITLTSDDTDLEANTTFTLPAGDTTSYTNSTNSARVRVTDIDGTNTNGAYYSWSAAVANTNRIYSTSLSTSVCPKNWDLPSDTIYNNLSIKADYSSTNQTTAAPSSFLTSGGFTNGATFYQTGYSYFWTNRSSSNTNAYGAVVDDTTMSVNTYFGTTYGGDKYYRKNIRCIAFNGMATISYDGNGTDEYPVTGSVAPQTDIEINNTNTMANGFTRTDWIFSGWNTAADGSGVAVAARASVSALNLKPGENVTLYAQWTPQYYTINYINNCMTYASASSFCTQAVSDDASEQTIDLDTSGNGSGTLANYNKWTLAGWKIAEWTTNADGTGTAYPVRSTYNVVGQSTIDDITLYAHWVPVYTIQYDGNGADNPNGMGTTDSATGLKSVRQINAKQGDSVTLLASNFKRTGYGFAGWSTNQNATVDSNDKIYGPMETIDVPAYPNNGINAITMYAVWVEAEKDGNNSPVYLQDFTTSDCSALVETDFNATTGVITPGSVIALTDKRDNQVYTIARLADGNCWMTENLRLEHDGTVGNNINDSSVTNQSLSQGYGGTTGTYGNFVGLADPEYSNFTETAAANSIYKSANTSPTDTYDPVNGTLEDIGANGSVYRFPRYTNINTASLVDSTTYTQDYTNVNTPSDSGTNYRTSNIYSYGNYYTWAAAIANTNRYAHSYTSEEANTSICPSNWHLPSSGSSDKEYGMLSQGYGGTGERQQGADNAGDIMSGRLRSFPNNLLYSGSFSSSSSGGRGVVGKYWSRTSMTVQGNWGEVGYTKQYMSESVYISSTFFETYGGSVWKYYGLSVRCLIGS